MLKITNYKNKIIFLSVIWILLLIAVSIWSVFTGQYPLTIKGLLDGDKMMLMVFFRLRFHVYLWELLVDLVSQLPVMFTSWYLKILLHRLILQVFHPGQVPVQHLLSLQFQLQHHLFQYVHLQEV